MKLLLASLTVLLVFSTVPAFAHNLLIVEPDNTRQTTALYIQDISTGSFTLERISVSGESHWYAFDGREGEHLYIRLLVPAGERSAGFDPQFDLIVGTDKIKSMDMDVLYEKEITRSPMYINEEMFVVSEMSILIPDDGRYYVRVFETDGDMGRFSFSIGGVEKFDLVELVKYPTNYFAINLFFGNYMLPIILVFLIVVIVTILIHFSTDKKK